MEMNSGQQAPQVSQGGDSFLARMEAQCEQIEAYRLNVMRRESRTLSLDQAAPIVLCDEVAWSLLGLSMASWNALASLALAALWLLAARRLSAA